MCKSTWIHPSVSRFCWSWKQNSSSTFSMSQKSGPADCFGMTTWVSTNSLWVWERHTYRGNMFSYVFRLFQGKSPLGTQKLTNRPQRTPQVSIPLAVLESASRRNRFVRSLGITTRLRPSTFWSAQMKQAQTEDSALWLWKCFFAFARSGIS